MPDNRPVPLGLAPSFGFGDRLGLATPGHVAAMRRAGKGVAPIYAQQSIREMTRTQRSPEQVMGDALRGASESGWGASEPQGADVDHLKTAQDVDRTAAGGFCFFTIDPSDYVDGQTDTYATDTLATKPKAVGDESAWVNAYKGRSIDLPTGTKIII